jgi:hypothetical protein
MMKWYFKLSVLGIISFLLLSTNAHSEQNSPFIESVVIFNTICAKCHEAQCSGRMSFDDAYEASKNHIIRHYGEAADKQWLQKELFTILNYMKEKCAYYPMDSTLPPKRVWQHDILNKMATLLEQNYFIPLGPFSAGNYHINLELKKDTKVTIHLVSEDFDMIIDDCFISDNMAIKIPFSITDPGNYYFRMYPYKPVKITRLAVVNGEDI